MPSELLTARHGSALVLTMRHPASLNSLSNQLVAACAEALDVAESDPRVRCVVLRGDGAHFSSGVDLESDGDSASLDDAVEALAESLRVFPKPVLGAVEGMAIGGGFALVLACDLVVAARDASFALGRADDRPTGESDAVSQLARWLPTPLLQQLEWFGEPLDAARLHGLGLIGWVCDSGCAFDDALRVAERLAGSDPDTLTAAKERVHAASRSGYAGQANAERQTLLDLMAPAVPSRISDRQAS
ncbi:MAG: enoyl-CoA hydratase-related protein [Burkholderiaceae bacterium]